MNAFKELIEGPILVTLPSGGYVIYCRLDLCAVQSLEMSTSEFFMVNFYSLYVAV